jgi:hypothetical protein
MHSGIYPEPGAHVGQEYASSPDLGAYLNRGKAFVQYDDYGPQIRLIAISHQSLALMVFNCHLKANKVSTALMAAVNRFLNARANLIETTGTEKLYL